MTVRAEEETVGPESGSTERSPGDSSDTAEGEAPPNTQRIGKYEILKPLGRGGMGAVYKAFDPVLERDVAIKVMLPETAGDPEQKQRFEREARAVARLSHPGIVTVFDLGYHTDGSPYIVMELLKGQDLLGRLREGPPLSIAQKVSIVIQVLDGLGHAHKAGIVHRDIKPANVFLSEGDVARIMDFGIAFCVTTGGTSKTVLGTVGYMSPEQVHGRRVDGRSDIFSVGTLLHEVLTGRRPFDAETPMATFYRIASGKAELSLPPGPEYEAFLPILGRALRVDVEERYPTAAEFAEALRAARRRLRFRKRSPSPARRRSRLPGPLRPPRLRRSAPIPAASSRCCARSTSEASRATSISRSTGSARASPCARARSSTARATPRASTWATSWCATGSSPRRTGSARSPSCCASGAASARCWSSWACWTGAVCRRRSGCTRARSCSVRSAAPASPARSRSWRTACSRRSWAASSRRDS